MLRAVYAASIPAAVALAAWDATRLVDVASATPGSALATAVGFGVGVAAADFTTGLVHWACDTWGSARTPVLGATLIRAFREHHVRPTEMLEHDWIEVNGEAATAAGLALAALTLPGLGLAAHPVLHGFLWSLIVFAALANQLHQWAHAPRPPRGVRWLQRAGIVLSPSRHARHHRGGHLVGYCITTGWTNRILDATGFWRALERALSTAFGVEARADVESDDAVDCRSAISEER